jgi:hypothetical protein
VTGADDEEAGGGGGVAVIKLFEVVEIEVVEVEVVELEDPVGLVDEDDVVDDVVGTTISPSKIGVLSVDAEDCM